MFSLTQKKTILFLLEPEDQNVLTPLIQTENVQSKYHTHLETNFGSAEELIRSTQADCVVISGSKQGMNTLLNLEGRLKSSELPVFILLLENPDLSISIKCLKCNVRDYLIRSECNELSLLQTLDLALQPLDCELSLNQAYNFINQLPSISYKCKNDEIWTMLFISQSSKTITGYTPDELINNKRIAYGNLIHPDDRQMVKEKVLAALSQNQPFSLTYRITDKSGITKWVFEQGDSIEENGQIILFGFVFDITEIKLSENQAKSLFNRIQTILEYFSDFVYITDLETKEILFANTKLKKFLGYDPTGKTCCKSLFGVDDVCPFCNSSNTLSYDNYETYQLRCDFLNLDLMQTETLIQWPDRKNVRLVLAVDITQKTALENEKTKLLWDIQARIKEKDCLYKMTSLLNEPDSDIELLNKKPFELVEIISSGFSSPQHTHCRIQYLDLEYNDAKFQEPKKIIHSDLMLKHEKVGILEVCIDDIEELIFLPEEQEMLDELASRISIFLEKAELIKSTQSNERRFQMALRAGNQGLYDWNMATGEIIFNDQFATMLEYDPKTFSYSYQKWKNDIHPADYEQTMKTLMEYFSGQSREYRAEFRLKTKSKKWKWILSVGEIVEWDSAHNPVRLIGTHTDIDAIKRHKELLELRVKERTIQLEEVAKQLESFSYSVSHDLRAPLRHINSFSNMLAKNAYEQLDKKSKHYIDVIISASTQMSKLIDDLLDFSRTGRVKISPHDIDLITLINESVSSFSDEIEIRTIEFVISPEMPKLHADPILLKQVFNNLISNAIKYTRPIKNARIKISYSENEHEHIVSISDNGVGFEMKFSNKLFGVFQRLHHNQEFEGTGIGLANVKRIIARHGGKVWAKGEPNKGATFSFSIPKHYATS